VRTPIHIGDGSQLGISNRTRYYIPGKTIWGAITARISRWHMTKYTPNIYKEVGKFVKNNLIFSYFFPIDKGGNILYPIYSERGFGFGVENNGFIMPKAKFESKYITSYISTAIDIESKTAEAESLHEIELLNPLKFLGYLFINSEQINNYSTLKIQTPKEGTIHIKNDRESIELFKLIKEIQVGGERTYGFGKLELGLDLPKSEPKRTNKLYNKYEVSLDSDKPTLNTDIALSHLNFKNKKNNYFDDLKEIKGDLEPIIWRDWDENKGMGHKKEFNMIALVPGSKFKEHEVKIGTYGIWYLN
jgi:hypothetical protein